MMKILLGLALSFSVVAGTAVNLEGKVVSYNDKFLTLQTKSKKIKLKNELLPAMIRTSPEKYLNKTVTIPLAHENYQNLNL